MAYELTVKVTGDKNTLRGIGRMIDDYAAMRRNRGVNVSEPSWFINPQVWFECECERVGGRVLLHDDDCPTAQGREKEERYVIRRRDTTGCLFCWVADVRPVTWTGDPSLALAILLEEAEALVAHLSETYPHDVVRYEPKP